MKLLLTSTGITNQTIADKLVEMVGKPLTEIHLAFIPTAINVSSIDDKRWMVDNIRRLDDLKIGVFDIVDIAATPKENWLPKLKRADVLFVEGGRPSYLKTQFVELGIDKLLAGEFSDKVYVGCSAGSSILGKMTIKSSSETPGYKAEEGLGFYDFAIRPHFFRPDRSQFNEELVQKLANKYELSFYAIDDNSAIAIENGKIEVVSEGKWKKFEPDDQR